MVARDWLKTLFKASYKGVPFWVETDEESGGRRVVQHQFPMRDLPFLEDLGEDLRNFNVSAYVASDRADDEAASLVAICATRGAGTLVLPLHGSLNVRCLSFDRERSKDRHGYLAFKLRFTREGAATSIVSVASLANLVFVNADALAVVASAAFAGAMKVDQQPDYVAEAGVSAFRDAVSILEAVRTADPVLPAASAAQRDEIQALYDDADDLLAEPATAETAAQRLIASARALGDGMAPVAAARSFEQTLGGSGAVPQIAHLTPGSKQAVLNQAAAARLARIAAMAVYCEAVVRIELKDRPSAITLRANVAEHIEAELVELSAADIDLFHALELLRDALIEYLSRSILDLAPVVRVEVNARLPSLYWGWRLYKDPNRSTQLVQRNRVVFPSLMPTDFEALAK